MKALIGLNFKQAKEVAKQELGVKRMGDARFQMILDEGVKRGDFVIAGDLIQTPDFDPFSLLEEEEDLIPEAPSNSTPEPNTKTPHPEVASIDPKLSSSDLPRAGDMYHYRSYTGEVVQGEVMSMICFAECRNPDGTWQTVAYQDLHLKKKGVPRETMLNHLNAYYQNNNHLVAERKRLTSEIADLETRLSDLKKDKED